MDGTCSLPTTNIIDLSCDRSKFFLVSFFKKKNRSTREKTCKEVQLMKETQQRIKLKQLKIIVYDDHLCITHSGNMIDQVTILKKKKAKRTTFFMASRVRLLF